MEREEKKAAPLSKSSRHWAMRKLRNLTTGQCVRCTNPATSGLRCDACRAHRRDGIERRKAFRKTKGMCMSCREPAVDFWRCAKHKAENALAARNRYRLKHGLALDAPVPILPSQSIKKAKPKRAKRPQCKKPDKKAS